jgi:hypothetical protein
MPCCLVRGKVVLLADHHPIRAACPIVARSIATGHDARAQEPDRRASLLDDPQPPVYTVVPLAKVAELADALA